MKQKRSGGLPLFWQLMATILLCWFVLLSVLLAVTMSHSLRFLQEQLDSTLMGTVTPLAQSAAIRQMIRQGECPPEVAAYLTDIVRSNSDLEYITVANSDSIRLYHIDPDFIGLPFEGDDEQRALAGERYFSEVTTEHFEAQRRAFHPVFDEEGQVMGFVMASATFQQIDQLRSDIYASYIRLFLMLAACTLIFSAALATYLGRNLRGVKPEDILRVYLAQNDILNALDEGMVSFDNTGRVRLANAAAAKMLGRREDLLVGQQVDDLIRAEDGSSLRDRKLPGLQSNHPNILVKAVQLPNANLWARQVLVLADKSEIMRYIQELGGTRHMLSTLRANTHEFLNKLQVISGLLQMGRTEDAQSYIGAIAAVHEHITAPVMKLIRNTSVAALVLGKAGNMRELDIELIIMNNSSLPEHSRYLSTDELVTVVGNLMENAIEAVNVTPMDRPRAVALQLTEQEKGLLIMVSDTGEGISGENLTRIYESGFSTKANKGRGVGMGRIKAIVDSHGGTIDVETEPGVGTTFTIFMNRERGGIV